jgi:hypothetical protein
VFVQKAVWQWFSNFLARGTLKGPKIFRGTPKQISIEKPQSAAAHSLKTTEYGNEVKLLITIVTAFDTIP